MKRILLNYASGDKFRQSQVKNSQTGLMVGFNIVYQMSDRNIDPVFYRQNKQILSVKRGAGYWLWKPYFIKTILSDLNKDDILFYADSGSFFVKDVCPLFEKIMSDEKGVGCFSMAGGHIEKQWTKRDTIRLVASDEHGETPQRLASFMMFRGTEYAKEIANKYLNHCCDYHTVSDDPNHDGWLEPQFKEHRHDQSVWSLLTKQNGVATMPEPTQWGQHHRESKPEDQYIFHSRDPQ